MKRGASASVSPLPGYVLITGGAGFIGTNLAHRLAREGRRVLIFDNLSRAGVERNLSWLKAEHDGMVQFVRGDCRDGRRVTELVRGASSVFHFAAQVAVTTSLVDPLSDFEVNARGTLNVLEAVRGSERQPPLLFTSTNKVYGALPDVALDRSATRYVPHEAALAGAGIDERRPLDFHSPYGCSKGAADQYVLDYARSFGISATVFRMSCIYGPHQFGTEDQGWVAHFLIRAMRGEPIVVYGDGLQVRDLLFVEDLIDAMLLASERGRESSGRAFNIGGGPGNTASLLELLELMETVLGAEAPVRFEAARIGDQRYYVSDVTSFRAATGWQPKTSVRIGIERLHHWLRSSNVGTPSATPHLQILRNA